MCLVPTKRLVLLAASALLLGTLIVSLRGISYTPADQQSTEDPRSMADPLRISDSTELVSLRVVVSLPDEAFRSMQALNRMFLLENTDMSIRLINLKADALDEYLQRAFRLGEISDIILLDNELVKHHAGYARLQPTDDYFTAVTETEYLPVIADQLKWNGYIWGIPFQIEPYILAFNEDVWMELTGEGTPGDAAWLWTLFRYNGLYIDDQDPMAYAAFAYILDQAWQFPAIPDDAEEETDASENGTGTAEGTAEETAEGNAEPENASPDDSEDNGVNKLPDESLAALIDSMPRERTSVAKWRDSVRASTSDATQSGNGAASEAVSVAGSGGDTSVADGTVDLSGRFAADPAGDPWDRLRSGELAAIIAPLHEYESRRSASISASLLPAADGNDGALLTGKSFVLSAETTAREAAFRWIRAMLERYHDEVTASVAGGYPADAEVYRLFDNNPTYGLLRSAVENGHPLMPDPYIEQKLTLIREQLPRLVREYASPQEAMLQIYNMFKEAGWMS